jgi:hypothetical protein
MSTSEGAGAGPIRALRDLAILSALNAGAKIRDVATEFGISTRSVSRIRTKFVEQPTALDQPPMLIVEDALRSYDKQLEVWSALAERYSRSHNGGAIVVAALRGYADTLERKMRVLRALGQLPANLSTFRMEGDLIRLGLLVLESLDQAAEGKIDIEEARVRVSELVARRELPAIQTIEGRERI